MNVFVFPGQGAQFEGMGKELYDSSARAKELFEQANEVLGFRLSDVMFSGSAEELKQTNITQPAIYCFSYISAINAGDHFKPDAVAGHSLGEFTALAASGALSFEDGLKLVAQRANAMRKACDDTPGTMAAILGLEDKQIEDCCAEISEVIVPANYNCPGQLVVSGSLEGINVAVEKFKEMGARRALVLPVGGAFHSPLMASAQTELSKAINHTEFKSPVCPIYQNVTASAVSDIEDIKTNLEKQLTAPVRWTQTMQQMIADGMTSYNEVGGKVLTGLLKKVDRKMETTQY